MKNGATERVNSTPVWSLTVVGKAGFLTLASVIAHRGTPLPAKRFFTLTLGGGLCLL